MGIFTKCHYCMYQNSADFVKYWAFVIQMLKFKTDFQCNPEIYICKSGHSVKRCKGFQGRSQSEIGALVCQLNEPAHEIMALFVLHKFILQTRMRSHPMGLGVWFSVGPFVYSHISCARTAKALARLRGCAGSLEPSLVAYVISTIGPWDGSNDD